MIYREKNALLPIMQISNKAEKIIVAFFHHREFQHRRLRAVRNNKVREMKQCFVLLQATVVAVSGCSCYVGNDDYDGTDDGNS